MTSHAAIPLLDLTAQNAPLLSEVRAAFERLFAKNAFVLGEEVSAFEREIAPICGAKHAIGVSSGTDALLLALMALDVGPGDEVVTTPFTFFATAGSIARTGARIVFADVDPVTFNLDPARLADAIGPRTKAIVPVHLYGQPCDLDAIAKVAGTIPIVEDAAQAIGATTSRHPVGGLGTIGAFSFYPTKNLGCFGDAGLATTNDDALAERMRMLRVHGSKERYVHELVGGNFRIDALQAAVLRVKLPHLSRWTEARRAHATHYDALFREAGLASPGPVTTPARVEPGHVYNQYVVRVPQRDALRAFLAERRIASEVYYPIPLHLQRCFAGLEKPAGSFPITERACAEVLALPIFPELSRTDVERVVSAIADFYRSR